MTIDICMAIYNGRQFIEKQLMSILENKCPTKIKFIFSDDSSADDSVQYLSNFFESYPHVPIQISQNSTNLGYVQNFGKSISYSSSSIIMLSDQDDIWPINRIAFLTTALDLPERELVVGNFSEQNINDFSFQPSLHYLSLENQHPFHKVNIYDYIFSTIPLYGCCFAFKEPLKRYILPIPSIVDSHDRWIALISILKGSCYYSRTTVTVRGLHHSNETRHLPLHLKSLSFSIKLLCILLAIVRILKVDWLGINKKKSD